MQPACHLMLDIETLGIRPGFVVASAAVVRFEDMASAAVVLNTDDQHALGLESDPDTLAWWSRQSPAAKTAAFGNPLPLADGLGYLHAWIEWAAAGRPLFLWCHGASFDAPMLAEVYRRAGMPCPWHYRDVRDTRTLYDLAGVDLAAFATGVEHVALDDAMAQTRAAIEALGRLAVVRQVAA